MKVFLDSIHLGLRGALNRDFELKVVKIYVSSTFLRMIY